MRALGTLRVLFYCQFSYSVHGASAKRFSLLLLC
nr:MAG TPA: hypothetical protein [Caudoviricetes sp.]